ncbi:hypothetical protein FJO69_02030 [[Mycoplasma] falconis]|uniref:F0F1 ATP synthase subunit gamma n=1 Tax=[Mycoplasma] falconis TaxID=92403 RepID=A0A501X9V7_9BACT|nr:hypothetical protein [[Mycoplasma] falconis]TPE57266.1 hypothetical protein FJO69_02030 [[Mycoplasma] falconis]
MNLKELLAKKQSLENIKKIIDSEKNLTLINILKLAKNNNFYLSRSFVSQNFLNNINKYYQTDSELLSDKKAKQTLWIYITESEKYQTDPYQKHEADMLKTINLKNDFMIAIGQRAIDFANNNKINLAFEYKENNVAYLSKFLPNLIQNFLDKNGLYNINYVINSSRITNSWIEVLPLNNFALKMDDQENILIDNIDFRKIKIYPDINLFVDSELNAYLSYITLALLNESSIVNEKYNLIAENQKLNDLDKRLLALNKHIKREQQQLEQEEIAILSYKKNGLYSK